MSEKILEDIKQRAVSLTPDHLDQYPNLTVACQAVTGTNLDPTPSRCGWRCAN